MRITKSYMLVWILDEETDEIYELKLRRIYVEHSERIAETIKGERLLMNPERYTILNACIRRIRRNED